MTLLIGEADELQIVVLHEPGGLPEPDSLHPIPTAPDSRPAGFSAINFPALLDLDRQLSRREILEPLQPISECGGVIPVIIQ